MFARTSLITFATLAVCVSANGISVPLAARAAPAAVFDQDAARLETNALLIKHQTNLANLQKNGESLGVGARVFTGTSLKRSLPVGVPLGNVGNAVFPANVTIGTAEKGKQEQTFDLLFDTLSADIWVPSSACTSGCDAKDRYDASKSTTKKPQAGQFTAGPYPDKTVTTGPILSDTVTIASVVVKDQFFSAVTTISDMVSGFPADGFVGLAFPKLATINKLTFLENAHGQGALKYREFGWFRNQDGPGSELFLGGTNPNLYKDRPEYHAINRNIGYWQINTGTALVNGKTVLPAVNAIMDTSGNFVYGPPAAVKTLMAAIPGSKLNDDQYGFYSVPCNTAKDVVAFNWGGKNWSSKNLIGSPIKAGSDQCIINVSGFDFGLGDDIWTLGDTFLSGVYTAFSAETNSVGFAELK